MQWSHDFEKIWELDSGEVFVADSYALNVCLGEVLACPYDDFPLIRIQDPGDMGTAQAE